MQRISYVFSLVLGMAALVALITVSGCQSAAHPDDKAAVYNTLKQNDLASVEVSLDRGSGVITLKGIVASPDQKAKAETLSRQAAPSYTVTNQLNVEDTGIVSMAKPSAAAPKKKRTGHPKEVAER
jgi:hypothetical protein